MPKNSGGWYDLYTGKWYLGSQHVTADAPYERMPVFVKAGSILPLGPELQYTSEKQADTILLNVYGGADASFNLYEDEGTNYNYEKGASSIIPIYYNDEKGTITIDDRKGQFKGMLNKRVFRINLINNRRSKALNFDTSGDKTIVYSGNKITIKINKP